MGWLDWLYPRRCVGCDRVGRYFCGECLEKVRLRRDWICPECGKRAVGGETHLGCRRRFGLDGEMSLLSYRGLVGRGVWRLKYEFLRDIEGELKVMVREGVRGRLKEREARGWREFVGKEPVVAGVPLHWRRRNWRGFNQAEVLAGMVGESLGLEVKQDVVERRKVGKKQTGLEREKRLENVKGIFKVKEGVELPRRALLVDDVWTTGATMRAVGEELKRGGVKEVWGWSLVR